LTFDFPGVKVGVAEYEEGPTGTTVLYFATPVVAAVDVRGGAPGTVNTDILRLAYDDKGTALEIELTGHTTSSSYLSVGKPVLLTPVATDEFEIVGPREDRLHIDRDSTGAIVGITLNPGPWAVHATRR